VGGCETGCIREGGDIIGGGMMRPAILLFFLFIGVSLSGCIGKTSTAPDEGSMSQCSESEFPTVDGCCPIKRVHFNDNIDPICETTTTLDKSVKGLVGIRIEWITECRHSNGRTGNLIRLKLYPTGDEKIVWAGHRRYNVELRIDEKEIKGVDESDLKNLKLVRVDGKSMNRGDSMAGEYVYGLIREGPKEGNCLEYTYPGIHAVTINISSGEYWGWVKEHFNFNSELI